MSSSIVIDSPTDEGDPNFVPWRNRSDGPRCSWVRADELRAEDQLLLSNKYVHTVVRSEPSEGDLWHLTLVKPTLVDADPNNPNDATASMPQVREIKVRPTALYRAITS